MISLVKTRPWFSNGFSFFHQACFRQLGFHTKELKAPPGNFRAWGRLYGSPPCFGWLRLSAQQNHPEIRRPCLALAKAGRRPGPPWVWTFAFKTTPAVSTKSIQGLPSRSLLSSLSGSCRPILRTFLVGGIPSEKLFLQFRESLFGIAKCPAAASLWFPLPPSADLFLANDVAFPAVAALHTAPCYMLPRLPLGFNIPSAPFRPIAAASSRLSSCFTAALRGLATFQKAWQCTATSAPVSA